jgi:hypothetical protein
MIMPAILIVIAGLPAGYRQTGDYNSSLKQLLRRVAASNGNIAG